MRMDSEFLHEYTLLGLNIVYYRKQKGYSQAELAKLLGVNPRHISRVENAKCGISLHLLNDMANLFGIPLAKLFEFED